MPYDIARQPASSISVTFFRLFIRTRTRVGSKAAGKRSNKSRGKRKELCLLVWSPCSFLTGLPCITKYEYHETPGLQLSPYTSISYGVNSSFSSIPEQSEQSANSSSFPAMRLKFSATAGNRKAHDAHSHSQCLSACRENPPLQLFFRIPGGLNNVSGIAKCPSFSCLITITRHKTTSRAEVNSQTYLAGK